MVSQISNDVTTWDAAYADLIEWVPDLIWPQSIWTYGQMRTDPQLRAVLQAYTLPILRAEWSVDPTGCRREVAQSVADNMGLTVKGDTDTVARRGPIQFATFNRLALLSLTFGHMPFQKVWDLSDGMTAKLVRLHERMPTSIYRILLTDDDLLDGIEQYRRTKDGAAAPYVPRKDLVWFAHEREGGAWQGRSLLRAAFGPWLMKRELWRVNATSMRRNSVGTPKVTAPLGATPQQVVEAQKLAQAHRGGDQSGVGLPAGFTMELMGITGSLPDPLPFIQYLDQQMTRSALAGIVDLGSTPNGSRALGDSFLDLLMLSLQAVGDEMAETMTQDIATDIVRFNFGEDEPVPNVTVTGIGESHEVNATTIKALMDCGAIAPDPELEAYVRSVWALPPKGVPTAPTVAPVAPPVAPAPGAATTTDNPATGDPTPVAAAAATEWPFRRPMTPVEAASKADFVAIDKQVRSAQELALAAWKRVGMPALRAQVEEQVKAAFAAGDHKALLSLDTTPDPKVLASLHTIAMTVAQEGITSQLAEAKAQGVTPTVAAAPKGPKIVPDGDKIARFLDIVIGLATRGYGSTAGKAAGLSWSADATEEDVAAAATAALDATTDSMIGDALNAALSYANQEGRFDALQELPPATYVATELMDGATCDPCEGIDGTEYETLDDAEADYSNGGYNDCDGGLRCRGIIVTVWPDQGSGSTDSTDGGDGA